MEIALGGRECDVDDGAVKDDHQLGNPQHGENPPPPAVVGCVIRDLVPSRKLHCHQCGHRELHVRGEQTVSSLMLSLDRWRHATTSKRALRDSRVSSSVAFQCYYCSRAASRFLITPNWVKITEPSG